MKKVKTKEKAFTIIELLVVIAILGLLASIVLVATKGAREKAQLVAVKQFSAGIKHALGADLIGEWRFEGNLQDSSGNGIDLEDQWGNASYEEGIMGKCVTSPSSIYIGTNIQEKLKKFVVKTGKITVEGWVKRNDWSFIVPAKLIDTNYIPIQLLASTGVIKFFVATGPSQYCIYEKTNISINNAAWHHLVATYDYNNSIPIKIFLDGKDIGSAVVTGYNYCLSPILKITPEYFYFGFLNGSLDEVRIYDASLSSAQIQQHYVKGAIKHGVSIKN